MIAALSPASTMARSACCNQGASGVVLCSGLGSRIPPICVATVPTRPGRRPAAESAAAARKVVVVLPSVPVIPITPSSREGSPYRQALASASARRAEATTTCGTARSGSSRSTTRTLAPAAAAWAA